MNAPSPADPAAQDIAHLDLLGVFHYVVAGISALFSLIPVLHLLIGLAVVTGRFPMDPPSRANRIRRCSAGSSSCSPRP